VTLCYHSIHPSLPFASASPAEFERHLEWLSERCDVISFRSVHEATADSTRERPAVAITFDDGYADNHEFALPLLQKFRLPATIFLTAGFVEADPAVQARFDALRGTSAGETRPLAWTQVRELRAAGIEIGGHTYSHPNLLRLDPDRARAELRDSKQLIEDRLQDAVDLLAYPFGKLRRHFSQQTTEIARETGYSRAAAVLFRSTRPADDPLALPRFFTTDDTVAELNRKVRGDWDLLGYWQEYAPPRLARLVSPGDFRF
jgi:peptidoglycan/xylan/chitin deacetylase (PgdA/CDA1 family)